MTDHPPKQPDDTCNGRKTDGSGYCNQPAGFGTNHPGIGRCKFHAGSSPGYEAKIADELEEAGQEGAIALKLRIKQLRRALEEEGEVDGKELDRLVRTALDRIGYGKTETRELTGKDGDDITMKIYGFDPTNYPDPDEEEDQGDRA